MAELKYWLWLTSLREPRNTEKRELLRRLGGPERLYYAEEEELALTGLSRVPASDPLCQAVAAGQEHGRAQQNFR